MDHGNAAREPGAKTTSSADGASERLLGSGHDEASDDPIVAEVRAAREALFAAAGYDLEEFGRQLRASEAADGITSVVRPPRAP